MQLNYKNNTHFNNNNFITMAYNNFNNRRGNGFRNNNRNFNTARPTKRIEEPVFRLASFVMHSAEMKRFAGLAIIKYLKDNGIMTGDKMYVEFNWEKISVTADGFAREFPIAEEWVVKSIAAATISFSAYATSVISSFLAYSTENGVEYSEFKQEELNAIAEGILTSVEENKLAKAEARNNYKK